MTDRPQMTTRFLRFNRDNPTVYGKLVRFTRQASAKRRPLSIALVYERLRWEEYVTTTGNPYRLSNSYRAYYARLIMHAEQGLDGVFQLRPSAADQAGHLVHPDHLLLFQDEAARDDGWLDEAAQVVKESA
jgi:hypothetical protein